MTPMHVVPRDDLVDHTPDESCVCGPQAEPAPRVDGSFGWLITHHSLDGREQREGATPPAYRDVVICTCDWPGNGDCPRHPTEVEPHDV